MLLIKQIILLDLSFKNTAKVEKRRLGVHFHRREGKGFENVVSHPEFKCNKTLTQAFAFRSRNLTS